MKGLLKALDEQKPAQIDYQLFDAKLIATREHLYFAALNALVAFKNKRTIAKSVAIETLLYASAQNQIQKATRLLGVKPDSSELAVLILGDQSAQIRSFLSTISKKVSARRDDKVLELTKEKSESIRILFGISADHLRTAGAGPKHGRDLASVLVDLVIERMALVAVQG